MTPQSSFATTQDGAYRKDTFKVHQNDIRALSHRQFTALLTIIGYGNLEIMVRSSRVLSMYKLSSSCSM
jgi:hypothetical protein